MEKRKKASLISAVALALMVSMAAGLFMQHSGLAPKSYLVFAGDSNPDEYGNQIEYVRVWQNKTGSWETAVIIYDFNYTQDMTVEIDANYPTYLSISVYINRTLCENNINLADDYTRVYVNVSTVFTNQLATWQESNGDLPPFTIYRVLYTTTTWTPATDTTYDVTVKYEAYY